TWVAVARGRISASWRRTRSSAKAMKPDASSDVCLPTAMIRWRRAQSTDDEDLVAMSLLLHAEDPGVNAMDGARVRRTLETFRREPHRGQAVVAEHDAERIGYALLVPFWSNELGGCVCEVDELYVRAAYRSRGIGRGLFEAIEDGTVWGDALVA